MPGKIHSVPNGITWEEFLEKYLKFFPCSHEPTREAAMAKEFERLTGINPYLKEKLKRNAGRTKREAQSPPKGDL